MKSAVLQKYWARWQCKCMVEGVHLEKPRDSNFHPVVIVTVDDFVGQGLSFWRSVIGVLPLAKEGLCEEHGKAHPLHHRRQRSERHRRRNESEAL